MGLVSQRRPFSLLASRRWQSQQAEFFLSTYSRACPYSIQYAGLTFALLPMVNRMSWARKSTLFFYNVSEEQQKSTSNVRQISNKKEQDREGKCKI